MTGTDDRLVYMANQIARFFATQRHEDPVLGMADHIAAFWDPAMRRRICALIDARGDAGLDRLASDALRSLRQRSIVTIEPKQSETGAPMGMTRGSDAG